MGTPFVGMTSYRDRAQSGVWDVEAVFFPWTYGSSLTDAGAAIAVLPPQPASPAAVAAALSGIDGLVITGGADIDPARYGAAPHPRNDAPSAVRDDWEIALTLGALERGMPFLGICRGAQVLNVARGGTLLQHVPDVVGNHAHEGSEGVFAKIGITVDGDSAVGRLYPAKTEVPVYHHQAIDSLGSGLRVTARSDFGIVEAVEDPSLPFCVAVQWHPEQDPRPALFEAFVEAVRAYASTRDVGLQS